MKADEIINALPDLKKASKLLDVYLNEKSRPLGNFKPENYFNSTKSKYLHIKSEHTDAVIKKLKKKKNEKYFKKFVFMLWNSNDFSKMIIAAKLFAFVDLNFSDFEKIVVKMDNWAHCDVFCTKVSGPYFAKRPKELVKLRKFALSKNPWKRRFAAVSLITTLKNPNIEHGVALDILSILVPDEAQREVLAAADWMIREYVKKNYKSGFSYMKKWALHYKKTGDSKVRWVLVRARHKLDDEEKKLIESLIGMKK